MSGKKIILIGLILFLLVFTGLGFYFVNSGMWYIRRNGVSIDLGTENVDFSSLDHLLEGKRLTLIGESHATNINYDLKLSMFKYLLEKMNYTIFMDEVGIGMGYVIDSYIHSQNGTILQYVLNSFAGTTAKSIANYKFLQSLAIVAQTHNFTFTGADLDHQLDIGILALDMIITKHINQIQNSSTLHGIHALVKKFSSFDFVLSDYPDDLFSDLFKVYVDLKNDLQSNTTFYHNAFPSKFALLERIVINGLDTLSFQDMYKGSSTQAFRFREDIIFANVLSLFNSCQDCKVFGQWGSAHVLQAKLDVENFDYSFTHELSKNPEFTGKILSLLVFYQHSQQSRIENGEWVIGKIDMSPPFKSIFLPSFMRKSSPTQIIDITGPTSPFDQKTLLLKSPSDDNKATIDFFQGLIIVSNSDPVIEWSK